MSVMTGRPPSFDGWRLARPRVDVGRRAGDVDLIDLANAARRLDRAAPLPVLLEPLHRACAAVAGVVLAPWVCDGVTLASEPTHLGVRGGTAEQATAWFDGVRRVDRSPASLGQACLELIAGVIDAVATTSGRRRRTVANMAADRLVGETARLRLHVADVVTDDDVAAFTRGCGLHARAARTVTITPDAGPQVVLRVPSVCCVLSRSPDPESCPTCPRRRSDADRRVASIDWVRSLDDDDFHVITGRARVTSSALNHPAYGVPVSNDDAAHDAPWRLIERAPTPAEYARLCRAVGWDRYADESRAATAIANSLVCATVTVDGIAVGMGRVIGDGAVFFYVQDIAVDPAHQSQGIGSAIMESLMRRTRAIAPPGSAISLFAAPEATNLYERFGLQRSDAGMTMYLPW